MTRPLQVFLCHASQDKPEVWKLHRYLKTRGVKPWLDVEDLLPGEDWEVEIPKALFSSDIILVCLSKNSVNKEGYVQKEIAFALDKALEKPEGTIFIIPVKLEDCELPKRLSRYQAVDLYRTDGRKRLLMGLNKRVANLGEQVLPIKIEETKQRTPKPIKTEPKREEKFIAPQPEKKAETLFVEEKKEKAKPFTRILNPSSLISQNPQLTENKEVSIERTEGSINLLKIAIVFTVLIGIVLVLSSIFDTHPNSVFFQTVTPTNDQNVSSATNTSSTLVILTPTITPTKSLAISTTTRLNIGSTTIGNDGMVLMYVPAGEFIMGSEDGNPNERPVHSVYLNSYWIDQTEVTNSMYVRCVEANQCNPPSSIGSYKEDSYFRNSEFDDYPVINVSWENANDYCFFVGRRLPTEAEWEKAARGTNGAIYPWGNVDPKDNLLNFQGNFGDVNRVGSYPAGSSFYSALDMAGNVFEWVEDWYSEKYYEDSPLENPTGPDFGEYRVLRGGSWQNLSNNVRSSYRLGNPPTDASNNIGFRCAMDADQ